MKFSRLALALAARLEMGRKIYLIGLWGISNAFVRARMGEDVYAVRPVGEGDPDVARHSLKSMNATRRVARLFQHMVIGMLSVAGVAVLQFTVLAFHRTERGVYAVVRGGDFMA